MNTNWVGPWGEIKLASNSSVGNAITAGVTSINAFVQFPVGSGYAWMEGRNYTGAAVIRYSLNPWIAVVKTTDSLATAANATDYSEAAQDNDASTDVVLSSLATATTNQLWIGAHIPFRGVFADVDAPNNTNTTAALSAAYLSATGPTMASLSITDGTAITSGTLQQDGAITWTVPTDWTVGTLRSIAGAAVGVPYSGESLYWVRLGVATAALDSSTTLNALLAMNRSTTYDSLVTGRVREFVVTRGLRGHGCIEALTDATTANLLVSVATVGLGSKFGT